MLQRKEAQVFLLFRQKFAIWIFLKSDQELVSCSFVSARLAVSMPRRLSPLLPRRKLEAPFCPGESDAPSVHRVHIPVFFPRLVRDGDNRAES